MFADPHVPFHNAKCVDILCSLIRDVRPHVIVNLGDTFDFQMYSRHSKTHVDLRALTECQDEGNALYDRIQSAKQSARSSNHKQTASEVCLEGNHDGHPERMAANENVALRGLITVPRLLDFKRRGIEWVSTEAQEQGYRLGPVYLTHGWCAGPQHGQKHLQRWPGRSMMYGHVHKNGMATSHGFRPEQQYRAISVGTLGVTHPAWNRGRSEDWQNGIAVYWWTKTKWDCELIHIDPVHGAIVHGKEY